jgi:hypothetical protein
MPKKLRWLQSMLLTQIRNRHFIEQVPKAYGSPAPFSTCPGCLCRMRSPFIAGNFRMSRLAQYRCVFSSYKFLLRAAGHHPSMELANLYRLFLSPVGYCTFSALFGTTLNLPFPQLNLHSTRVRRKASRLPSMQSIFSLAMRRE